MHSRSVSLCCVVACAVVAAAACDVQVGDKGVSFGIARGKATEDWSRTYTLPTGGRLDITNVNGGIDVEPSTSSKVEVVAHREARAGSDAAAQQLLARETIVEQVAADHVRLESRRQGSLGLGNSMMVKWEVRVPPGLTVSVVTQNGGVTLDNVRGTLTASTTNGGVVARDVSGRLAASTVNGGVQLALAEVNGDVEARTVNGGIRIGLPPDANARIDASVVNGGISVDDALTLTNADRGPKRVAGTLNAGGPTISAQTTNGGVRIYGSGGESSGLGRRRR